MAYEHRYKKKPMAMKAERNEASAASLAMSTYYALLSEDLHILPSHSPGKGHMRKHALLRHQGDGGVSLTAHKVPFRTHTHTAHPPSISTVLISLVRVYFIHPEELFSSNAIELQEEESDLMHTCLVRHHVKSLACDSQLLNERKSKGAKE